MKKSKKIIIAALVVLVLVGGGLFFLLNTPSVVAARTLSNFADDFLSREEFTPIKDTVQGGSIKFSVSADQSTTQFHGNTSGKLYLSEKAIYLEDFSTSLNTTDYISGDLYVSDDMIYVNEEEILDGAYGVKFSKLVDELTNSIFAPNSNSGYELSQKEFDQLISAIEDMEEGSAISEDATALLEDVAADMFEIVLDNSEIDSEGKEISLNGEKTDVRLISITIDEKALKGILADVRDYLVESKDIPKFLDKYEDLITTYLGTSLYDKDEYDSLGEAYKGECDFITEEFNDLIEDINEGTLVIEIATPSLSSTLLRLDVIADDTTLLTVDCGKDGITDTDEINITVGNNFTVNYKVEEEDDDFSLSATLIFNNSTEYKVSFETDSDNNSYTVSLSSARKYSVYTVTNSIVLSGKYTNKSGSYTFSANRITFTDKTDYTDTYYKDDVDETVKQLKAEITVTPSDKMPSVPKNYDSISDITKSDIEKWTDRLRNFLSDT